MQHDKAHTTGSTIPHFDPSPSVISPKKDSLIQKIPFCRSCVNAPDTPPGRARPNSELIFDASVFEIFPAVTWMTSDLSAVEEVVVCSHDAEELAEDVPSLLWGLSIPPIYLEFISE